MNLYINKTAHVVRLLVRYPSAIPYLLGGISSATAHIDNLVKEEYLKKPIMVKRTEGFEINLNPKDNYSSPLIGITGTYEPEITRMFKQILRRGNKVIDVGANMGWFTLLAARAVGSEGGVISFEPEPVNYALLATSVARNGFTNVKLFNEAVSDVDGELRLNLHGQGNAGAHSIVRDFGGEGIFVKSCKLDSIAEKLNLDYLDIVKVDVEGAEPQVVSGMRSLIAQEKVSKMIMEWNPNEWAKQGELLSMLFEVFHVWRINQMSFSQLTKISRETLPASQANLYLVKK